MTIGERIKKARKAKGMKQGDLAEILGCTKQNISRFEKSKIS